MWQKRVVQLLGGGGSDQSGTGGRLGPLRRLSPAPRRVLQQEGAACPSCHLSLPTSHCSCPLPPPWAHRGLKLINSREHSTAWRLLLPERLQQVSSGDDARGLSGGPAGQEACREREEQRAGSPEPSVRWSRPEARASGETASSPG